MKFKLEVPYKNVSSRSSFAQIRSLTVTPCSVGTSHIYCSTWVKFCTKSRSEVEICESGLKEGGTFVMAVDQTILTRAL